MDAFISFPAWLHNHCTYKDNTIRRYIAALDKAPNQFDIVMDKKITDCTEQSEFSKIYDYIFSHSKFNAVNESCHRDLQAALNAYKKYLDFLEADSIYCGDYSMYSPQWFHEQAQTSEMLAFKEKADYAREAFCREFGMQAIQALEGRELLTRLFYNDEDSKSNLCYTLEFDPIIRELFGSIAGGSSFKFGLFYHKKHQCWMSGSPSRPQVLTEEEALHTAEKIRGMLLEGAEILDAHTFVKSPSDYELLYDELRHIPIIDNVWVLKYYQMLFPEILPVFYAKNYQEDILSFLHVDPSPIPLVRMGQIMEFIRECGIPSTVFAQIYYRHCQQYIDSTAVDALADTHDQDTRYWLYAPGEGSSKWDEFYAKGIMAIGWAELGNLRAYRSKKEMKYRMKEIYDPSLSYMNAAHATWQFTYEIKPGDVVFVKKGRNQIIGRGIVCSDYEFSGEPDYPHFRSVEWTHKGVWPHPNGQAVMKTLTDITPYIDYVEKLNGLFADDDEDITEEQAVEYTAYTEEDFLNDVYMSKQEYDTLSHLLKVKKNIILQGAPGVGKTFAAKRLAYSIMGMKDQDRVMMVQFHQSYSYEDFIMGFRPSESGFELKKGAFYNFCKKAEIDSDNDYFFIIDEINRGNLSKIFGELFMLIERDKRGIPLQLLYSDERFTVPSNVYIIGMMNTADRSLAMLDYALRRRFAFYEMRPGFSTDGFREYRERLGSRQFDNLIHCVETLNAAITEDESLGDGFCIGHSYFCNLDTAALSDGSLSDIVEYELIPLLKEYWFDEPQKVRDWSDRMRSAVK